MTKRRHRAGRLTRMAWLVKRPTYLRGTPIKGCRPFIMFLWSDGTSEDATSKRRIERNRERGRSPRP